MSKIVISKQTRQVYVKTFYLIFVYLRPKCRNLKRIGAPEVKRHFKVQTRNLKLKAPRHILVFISQENPTKQVQHEIRSALGHLSASRGDARRIATS